MHEIAWGTHKNWSNIYPETRQVRSYSQSTRLNSVSDFWQVPFVISWDKMTKMSISRKQGNFPETKTTKLSMFPSWNVMRTREGATTFMTQHGPFSPHVASRTRVKTYKRWQAAHLYRRETAFENLFHIAPLRRTRSGILQFKFKPWYSFYIADQDTARYSLLGKIV